MTYLLIPIGALARLLPHLPNFTPIGGMALFGGAHGSRRSAIVAPLAAMALSDLFLGTHASLPFVYASFVAIALLGMALFRNGVTAPRVIGAATLSSLILFALSNFGVWATGTMYPHTWQGLLTCYALALPFLRNTMAGDLFYAGVFFGGYALATRHAGIAARVPVKVRRSDDN